MYSIGFAFGMIISIGLFFGFITTLFVGFIHDESKYFIKYAFLFLGVALIMLFYTITCGIAMNDTYLKNNVIKEGAKRAIE